MSRLRLSAILFATLASVALAPGYAQDLSAPASAEPDAWYPRMRTSEAGTVVMHAPQIDSWSDFSELSAWAAFEVRPLDSDLTSYGSLHLRVQTEVDLEAREVLLLEPELLELRIQGVAEDAPEYALVRDALFAQPIKVPLDLVLEYLPQALDLPSVEGLNPEPPEIFVANSDALLLALDSEPVWLPIEGSNLEFVLNTNWDVLREADSNRAYLLQGDSWLTARQLDRRWSWADSLPAEFDQLPDDGNWAEIRAALPQELSAIGEPDREPPDVFYSEGPAELIQFDGEPDWRRLVGTELEFAINTAQEVLRAGDSVYLLLSGRWFVASDFDGPWSLARALPDVFAGIPADHAKSYLRASVPGTVEAWEAALVATIPRRATISRDAAALAPTVSYAGDPVFQPIEGTDLSMAMNTSFQVLGYDGSYYLCHDAIWYRADTPEGPWTLADAVPDQVLGIPPSSPAHNTSYVAVAAADDETVTYEYTSGYEEAYVSNNTVVYGTGYVMPLATVWLFYEAWGYPYPYYPYYPWPPTYGYGSWYNPATGRYGESIVGYGPYGAARSTAVYNPTTGTYARGQAFWDSDEYAGRSYGYNPNTNTGTAGNRYHDFEDREGWSQRVVTRGDEWRYRQSEWSDGQMVSEFESSRGTEGQVSRTLDGDTLTSEGTIQRGDQQASFESTRERQGEALVSEGTITGENRSAEFESTFQDRAGEISIDGSEGGSGDFTREAGNGEITGSGTISRNGETIETETRRTAEGVQRSFETGDGGQGTVVNQGGERSFVGQTSGGDVYAGRDGEVYQRTDDGWSKVENPGAGAQSAAAQSRSTGTRDFSTTQPTENRFGETPLTQPRSSLPTTSLERDYASRTRGYERYGTYQRGGASAGGGFGQGNFSRGAGQPRRRR